MNFEIIEQCDHFILKAIQSYILYNSYISTYEDIILALPWYFRTGI